LAGATTQPKAVAAPQPKAAVAPPAPYAYPQSYAPAVAGAGGPIIQNIYVNQTLPTVAVQQQTIGLLIRAVWFLFVGLWLGQMWLLVAWLLNLSLIGLPLGLWMLNMMPQVMTLRPTQQRVYLQSNGNQLVMNPAGPSFIVRTVYFVLIGWWVSLLWLQIAWFCAASLIGLPLAFLMFEHTAAVATLGD
jgi:uncharacterized membrane protein YccF (DUF307 family)